MEQEQAQREREERRERVREKPETISNERKAPQKQNLLRGRRSQEPLGLKKQIKTLNPIHIKYLFLEIIYKKLSATALFRDSHYFIGENRGRLV